MIESSFWQSVAHELQIFDVRDALEIAAFATIVYQISAWLKKDKQKNLVPYFYAYCFAYLTTYFANLNTLNLLLIIAAPVVSMLFILIHQETLQRNFVSVKNAQPLAALTNDWLEELIRASLVAINNNKSVLCVIEHSDTLQEFINCPFLVSTELNGPLLDILLDSSSFDAKKIIWVNSKGQLVGINATWKHTLDETWTSTTVKTLPTWKQDALLITAKTDAIIFCISPETRLFELVIHGKMIEQVSTHHMLTLIKNNLMKQTAASLKGDNTYANQRKKQSIEQSQS